MTLTLDRLLKSMPQLKRERAEEMFPHLAAAAAEFEINTPLRLAAFLAQLAHESGEFRWMEEIASGEAYEGRKHLGNTEPGDGKRFKGRGPIQLTGRANYRTFGNLLGIDLEGNPQLAAQPSVGFRVAALYWKRRGLNPLADREDLREITRRINGGFNGMAERTRYYGLARAAFGLPPWEGKPKSA